MFFSFLIKAAIRSFEDPWHLATFQPILISGVIGLIIFSSIGIYSGVTMSRGSKGTPFPMDCPLFLVNSGPYFFLRDLMAVAGIELGLRVGIIYMSYLILIYALTGAVVWHYFVRPAKEKDLEARFES